MPYGVLLYKRCENKLGCACSSREARLMHAPWQEVTGGHDGPRGEGSRQSSSEFGLQPERHVPAGPIRRLWSYETDRRQGCVCRDVAAMLRQNNTTTPCL